MAEPSSICSGSACCLPPDEGTGLHRERHRANYHDQRHQKTPRVGHGTGYIRANRCRPRYAPLGQYCEVAAHFPPLMPGRDLGAMPRLHQYLVVHVALSTYLASAQPVRAGRTSLSTKRKVDWPMLWMGDILGPRAGTSRFPARTDVLSRHHSLLQCGARVLWWYDSCAWKETVIPTSYLRHRVRIPLDLSCPEPRGCGCRHAHRRPDYQLAVPDAGDAPARISRCATPGAAALHAMSVAQAAQANCPTMCYWPNYARELRRTMSESPRQPHHHQTLPLSVCHTRKEVD